MLELELLIQYETTCSILVPIHHVFGVKTIKTTEQESYIVMWADPRRTDTYITKECYNTIVPKLETYYDRATAQNTSILR